MNRRVQSIRAFALFVVLAAFPPSTRAEQPLWREVTSPPLVETGNGARAAADSGRFKDFELDEGVLVALLAQAPMEYTQAATDLPGEITLPTPAGALERFHFVESPILAPELAAQYPEIRTYRGWGIDDPTAATRFLHTSRGFRALILSPNGSFSVAPIVAGEATTYRSIDVADLVQHGSSCSVGSGDSRTAPTVKSISEDQTSSDPLSPTQSIYSSGSTLRILRLAAVATGEYTTTFGSPQAAVTAIAEAVNAVDLLFQVEMNVFLMLNYVAIYTDPLTDPYESGDMDEIPAENQEVLDEFIGEANYDIGHLFDTRFDGGRGRTASACMDGEKGRGLTSTVTGYGNETIAAHELGHQLGAEHTFNGDCGDNAENRNDDTAYEPDCGKTIMSYGGANRVWQFHGESLRAIASHLGTVNGCGTSITNNSAPSVSVTPPVTGLVVPVGTPFDLPAQGSDPDQNPLTYSWESFDHGSPGPWNADRGDNPLFESQSPTAGALGTFPPLPALLANNPPPLMATASRLFHLLVTARDHRGGFAQDTAIVPVTDESGPFVVTAPASGTAFQGGQSIPLTWDVAGSDGGLVDTPRVRILYSTETGFASPTEIAADTSNDGAFTFTPAVCIPTETARIRVEAIDNIFFAVSPAFRILGPTITSTAPLPPRPNPNLPTQLHVTQGGPAATDLVATVNDSQQSAGSLVVRPVFAPPNGFWFNVSNDAGGILATASVRCGFPTGLHRVEWEVENTVGCARSNSFNVEVLPNTPPTSGTYPNVSVVGGGTVVVTPSTPPSDPDGNLESLVVWNTSAPLSATITADPGTGVVTVATDGSTQPGTYELRVQALDTCTSSTSPEFDLTVENTPPQITLIPNSLRTTRGGVFGALVPVATVSDVQDVAGLLEVSATAPSNLTVRASNSAGTVSADAMATCDAATGSHRATLLVTDSDGGTASRFLPVLVDPNLPPTVGTYFDSAVTAGGTVVVIPNALPLDPNNPASPVSISVNPPVLPGGGQVLAYFDRIEVRSVPGTIPNTYPITVTATDVCNDTTMTTFRVTVRGAACPVEQSTVFVADTGNHRIQRFTGTTWQVIGSGIQGTGLGQFTSPEAVVASANGQKIYVADTGNSRIQWSQNGGGSWALFASGIIPQGLLIDRDGNLYVSDSRDNLVLRYRNGDPGSPVVLAASGAGAGRVQSPAGLAIDCRMNLYVADTGNNRILKIVTADSTMIPNTGTVFAASGVGLNPAQVTAPQGVAVDDAGRLYVADTGNNRILSIPSAPIAGAATALATVGGAIGQVRAPEGVTIARFTSGQFANVSSIAVSDTTNDRVQGRRVSVGPWSLLGANGLFKKPSKIR